MSKLPPYMQHAVKKPDLPAVFDPAKELDALTEIAMRKKREILELELPGPRDHRPEAVRTRALVLSAADSTINQKIKVDESSMRQRQDESRQAILERIALAMKGE